MLHFPRTNFSCSTFNRSIQIFKIFLKNKGYLNEILDKYVSEVHFTGRGRSLKNKEKSTQKKILPFVTQYHNCLALPNLKSTVMEKWHFIQNQWHSGAIFKEPSQSWYWKQKYPGQTYTQTLKAEDLKLLGNGKSCTGLSTWLREVDLFSSAFFCFKVVVFRIQEGMKSELSSKEAVSLQSSTTHPSCTILWFFPWLKCDCFLNKWYY